jgi:hypothetical protein
LYSQEFYAGEYMAAELDEIVRTKKDLLKSMVISNRYETAFKEFFEPVEESLSVSLLHESWFQESLLFASSKVQFDTFEELIKYLYNLKDLDNTKRALHLAHFMLEERVPKLEKEQKVLISWRKKIDLRLSLAITNDDYAYMCVHPSQYILEIMSVVIEKHKQDGKLNMDKYDRQPHLKMIYSIQDDWVKKKLANTKDIMLQSDSETHEVYVKNRTNLSPAARLKCLKYFSKIPAAADELLELLQNDVASIYKEEELAVLVACVSRYSEAHNALQILISVLQCPKITLRELLSMIKNYRSELIPNFTTRKDSPEAIELKEKVIYLVNQWSRNVVFKLQRMEEYEQFPLQYITGCDPDIDMTIAGIALGYEKVLVNYYSALKLLDPEQKQLVDDAVIKLLKPQQGYEQHVLNLLPHWPEKNMFALGVDYGSRKIGNYDYSTITFKIKDKPVFTSEVNIQKKTFFVRFEHDLDLKTIMEKQSHWIKLLALYYPSICVSHVSYFGSLSELTIASRIKILNTMVDLGFQIPPNYFAGLFNALLNHLSEEHVDAITELFWKLLPKVTLYNTITELNSDSSNSYEERQYLNVIPILRALGNYKKGSAHNVYEHPYANLPELAIYMKHLFTAKSIEEAAEMLGTLMSLFKEGHAPFLLDIIIDYLRSIKELSVRSRVAREQTDKVLKEITLDKPSRVNCVFWEGIALSRWING